MNEDYKKIKDILEQISKCDERYENAIHKYSDDISKKKAFLVILYDELPKEDYLNGDLIEYIDSINKLRDSLDINLSEEYRLQFNLKRDLIKKLKNLENKLK